MSPWTPTLRSSRTAAALALVTLAAFAVPPPAGAQASREGPTFAATNGVGVTVKRPDIAYDPVNNVYLAVSGGLTHGRFVAGDGTPLGGVFYIPESTAYNQTPRVTYGAALGGFLVTWLDTRANPNYAQVWGRLVRFSAGGVPAYASGDFLIGAPIPGVDPERGPATAYSTTSQRFLVLWHQYGGGGQPANDIRGQLVSASGQLVGGVINVSFDNHFQGEMGVDYSPGTNQFLVAYRHFYEPAGPATVQIKTVSADTGALGAAADITSGVNTNSPEVTYNSVTGQFLVAWWQANNYYGRFVAANGSVAGNTFPFIVNYGGYDSLGIRHNPVSNTYFAVIHGRAPSGLPQEDVGAQISATGVPDVEFDVTATGNRLGNFNPRIASSTASKEWMLVTSTAFVQASGQRIRTTSNGGGSPPPPPPGPPPSETIDLNPGTTPNGSWFLAEGVESGTPTGFHTFYLIANENDVPVNVRAYFASDAGVVTRREFQVGPRTRTTVALADVVGPGAFGAVFQSTTVNSDIFVERSIYWGNHLEGSTGATATKSLGTDWLFAEGSRGGEYFANFFLLFNPTTAPATTLARYYLDSGTVVERQYVVPAQSRLTINANDIPALAGRDFSTWFTGNSPSIVAERAMYWGVPWIGGTATLGSPSFASVWHFAEGAAAPNFETFYLIQNPNPAPISVTAWFYKEVGPGYTRTYTVPANSRFTVYLNGELGNVGAVAATFSSDGAPMTMERAVYWGVGRVEGTASVGATSAAYEWHLPEGTAGGAFDTFMLLSNPTSVAVSVDITLYVEGIGRFTAPASMRPVLAPYSRKTIYMNDFLTQLGNAEGYNLAGASFATRVRVVNDAAPIVVEHAIYWQRDGANFWRGGSGSFGIPR